MQSLYDTGDEHDIQSTYDGAVYDIAVGGDCVCSGIGDEFNMTYSASSLTVSFTKGSEAIIGGAFFKVNDDGGVSVELEPESTIYLCARIDKTQPNGQTAQFAQCTAQSMKKENLNGSGNIRDLLLYVITTNANGVVDVQDKRFAREGGDSNITTATLEAGETEITIEDGRLTTNSIVSFYTSIYGVSPDTAVVNNGSVVLTFGAQDTDMVVGVKVEGNY